MTSLWQGGKTERNILLLQEFITKRWNISYFAATLQLMRLLTINDMAEMGHRRRLTVFVNIADTMQMVQFRLQMFNANEMYSIQNETIQWKLCNVKWKFYNINESYAKQMKVLQYKWKLCNTNEKYTIQINLYCVIYTPLPNYEM